MANECRRWILSGTFSCSFMKSIKKLIIPSESGGMSVHDVDEAKRKIIKWKNVSRDI
jgi:hypothetical protein